MAENKRDLKALRERFGLSNASNDAIDWLNGKGSIPLAVLTIALGGVFILGLLGVF